MGTVRAAVVLFVDVDEEKVQSPQDLAVFVQWGLHQAGFDLKRPMSVRMGAKTVDVRIVDVMEAGMAIGNGYLWTEVTTKAYTQRGIYTDKQQAQLDAEIKWEQEHAENQQEVHETSTEKDA